MVGGHRGYHLNFGGGNDGDQEGLYTSYSGGNQPHNNIPPFLTCYMFERYG